MGDEFAVDSQPSAYLDSPLKRVVDLVVATIAAIVAVPVIAIGAIAMASTSRGPILFRQERSGRGGVPFTVAKLRTMNNARLPSGELAPDDQRLTAVGRWLRRTSIDELPQVWNVLTGSMSLIGPRPLPRQYDALYSGPQRVRLLARPGITGLSQVTLRNAGDWKDKLALDTQYVTTASLRLDLSILARTVTAVVSGRGVSASGHVTMPEFTGDTPEPG